jgi:hypothetical protein
MPARDDQFGFFRGAALLAALISPSAAPAAEQVRAQLRVSAVILPACRVSSANVGDTQGIAVCTNGGRGIVTVDEIASPARPTAGAALAPARAAAPTRVVTITY